MDWGVWVAIALCLSQSAMFSGRSDARLRNDLPDHRDRDGRGKEGVRLFREEDLREMLRLHIVADSSDLSQVEGHGALNFLALDDRKLVEEAEPLHPESPGATIPS